MGQSFVPPTHGEGGVDLRRFKKKFALTLVLLGETSWTIDIELLLTRLTSFIGIPADKATYSALVGH